MKKRIISLIMMLGIMFVVMSPLTSLAVDSGDKLKVYNLGAFNGEGHRYNHGTSSSGTGISMIDINGKKHNRAWGYLDAIHIGSSSGPIAYCVQMGTAIGRGNYTAEDTTFNDLWRSNLSSTARRYISLVSMYGYPNFTYSAHWVDAYAATQCLIWEFSLDFRISANGFNNPNGYAGNQIYNLTIKGTPAEKVYNKILDEIKAHVSIPNYASEDVDLAPVHAMTWNNSTNRCEYRLPTSQIGDYNFTTLPAGVSVTTWGPETVFYTTVDVDPDSGVVTLKKNLPEPQDNLLVFTSPGAQACIAGTAKDPVAGYFKLNSEIRGNLRIIKTSEDDVIEGISFNISGNGINQNVTTQKDGTILIENLRPGVYTVSETAIDRYKPQESQQITVISGQTSTVTFNNVLKKFNLQVKKADSQTGVAQGDATLGNAKYGLFQNGVLVDEYYTDIFGEFDTKTYICGDGWTLKELEPSKGYLLNPIEYHIGAEAENFTAEYNPISIGVTEDVIMGSVVLVKHSDDGSTQIESPEVGASFEIYLTKAGSYNKAKSPEKDILVVDKSGFATSNHQLPYGWYTVHQKDGWVNAEKIEDFQVFVGKHNEVYYYIINNAPITAKIKVEKRDSDTGKLIAASGIGFKLYNPSGKQIIQHYDYPYPTDVEIYYTNESGWLMLPETLAYGKSYKLVEVRTAEPYYLSSEPVFFDVDGSETVVTVTKYNQVQMGKIHIDKFGEVFASVSKSGEIYQPIYEVQSLAGAVVDFYAAEDIVINGDIKVKKDTIVSTVTTGENGAHTGLLFPGKYYYIERIAPHSMVVNHEKHFVEIVYAGQTVKESFTTTFLSNKRQKTQIDLMKIMEQDDHFGVGTNGEILAVQMGLFAENEIVAPNGDVIPKDGLLEIVSVNENGTAIFNTDIPVSAQLYVKEISTSEGYLISEDKFPVSFEYAGQEIAIVHLQVNEGKPIENKIIRGNIRGKKVGENGEGLSGAVMGLFRNDETEFTKENAIVTTKSTEDGGFSFENVPYGNWICREIAPPTGYVLSDKSYSVIISEKDSLIEIEVENRRIRGSVKTTKIDEEYPENKLSDAVFDIYLDTDGNGIFDENIDSYFGTMTETENGIYQLNGLLCGGYFLHERTAPTGFIKDEGYYYFTIDSDSEIVEVENNAGIGFTNKAIPEVPKTGDNTMVSIWLGVFAIALGGFISLIILKRMK